MGFDAVPQKRGLAADSRRGSASAPCPYAAKGARDDGRQHREADDEAEVGKRYGGL